MKEQESNRSIGLDLVRVIAMFFVIGIHCELKPLNNNSLFQMCLLNFLFSCNGMFYMLSGRFALSSKCNTKKEYANYYIKKVCSIIIPMVLVTIAIEFARDIYINGFSTDILNYLKMLYEFIMFKNAESHLWFLYPLIGMLLSAPFLAKILDKMEDWELKLLFVIAIGWNMVSTYFTIDFNIGFSYSDWFLANSMLYFFAGYFCKRIVNENNKKIWYLLGIIGYLITVFGSYIFPTYQSATNNAPAYVFFTMAIYIFIQYEIKIKKDVSKNIVSFLAIHSYGVYLVHFTVGNAVARRVLETNNDTIYFIAHTIIVFFVSFVCAMLMNYFVIFPIEKFVKKKWLS